MATQDRYSMTDKLWISLGYRLEMFGIGLEAWEKVLPNGVQILVTGIDESGLPPSKGPFVVNAYPTVESDDADRIVSVEISERHADTFVTAIVQTIELLAGQYKP